MSENEDMVERVGAALRQECQEIFGSTWDNDVAWRLARAAVAAMREPTVEMAEAGFNAKPIPSMRAPATHYYLAWKAMIDAALPPSPEAE